MWGAGHGHVMMFKFLTSEVGKLGQAYQVAFRRARVVRDGARLRGQASRRLGKLFHLQQPQPST